MLLLLVKTFFIFCGIGRFQSAFISSGARFFFSLFLYLLKILFFDAFWGYRNCSGPFVDSTIYPSNRTLIWSTLVPHSVKRTIHFLNVTDFHPVNTVEPRGPVNDNSDSADKADSVKTSIKIALISFINPALFFLISPLSWNHYGVTPESSWENIVNKGASSRTTDASNLWFSW